MSNKSKSYTKTEQVKKEDLQVIEDLESLYEIADFTHVEPEAKQRIKKSYEKIKNILKITFCCK